ncbi:MAG: hypothetical protein IE927_14830 [Rhodobacterales bacterium]|nr:hypothetical protein [Rhodobacterales bacterium]
MADPNLHDFQQRVARISADRARGRAFEAEGTLGLSRLAPPPRRRRPLLGPLAFVLCCGIGLKAALLAEVGQDSYADRVARLAAGDGIDRLGAALMQPDPVSLALARGLQRLLP